ncbi:MAG: hypothetical protein N2483_08210 [Burkholderiaceae bacterium]|nr:hypothetical protein [Burkholderiaceae bacterium]
MSLLNRHVFRPETAAAIEAMGILAEQIADRWAGGWPKRTRKLDDSGLLIEALKRQVELEREVLAQAREMTHLAQHEILQVFGIDPQPPA